MSIKQFMIFSAFQFLLYTFMNIWLLDSVETVHAQQMRQAVGQIKNVVVEEMKHRVIEVEVQDLRQALNDLLWEPKKENKHVY